MYMDLEHYCLINKIKILTLNIVNTYNPSLPFPARFDCVKGYWRINIARAKKYKYIVGLDKDRVVCIFRLKDWYNANTLINAVLPPCPEPNRKEFDGVLVGPNEKIYTDLIGKRIINPRSPIGYYG